MDQRLGIFPSVQDTGYADISQEYEYDGLSPGAVGGLVEIVGEEYKSGNDSGGARKRVKVEDGNEEGKVKKTRQSR
jgi:hypothetical protein